MDSRALLEAVDHPGDLAEIQYRRRDIMDYWNPNIMATIMIIVCRCMEN